MKTIFPLLLLFLTLTALAQNDLPQRKAFNFKLAEDDKHYSKIKVPQSDYFLGERMLEIYATEKLNIEVTIQKDTISVLKVVRKILHPERTIVVDFRQEHEGRKVIGMLLKIKNPFNKKLVYDASKFITGHDDWIKTKALPAASNSETSSTWKEPIITLCLSNWRFVE